MNTRLLTSLFSLSLAFAATSAHARPTHYLCKDKQGYTAYLTVSGKSIVWDEEWHAAQSGGKFIGKETTPYSQWRGYNVYKLTDFDQSADSYWALALEPISSGRSSVIDAYTFFANDDHDEDVTRYSCELK